MITPDRLAQLTRALADRYRLERELGQGGMAVVFLATDLRHDRTVALKVLRPELAAALGSERFLQEIRLSAQLNHPHILPLHDSGAAEGFFYYVMPLVDGESLRERVTRERQLTIDEAVRLTNQIGDALAYAHDQGVVHRDVKPENILLSRGGHAWVADFGIARAVKAAGGDRLTETGLSLGTPAYMSPEQAGGDRELDGRSDQYSLACVTYELLAGQPPFTGPTGAAVMARQVIDPVPPLSTLRPGVPSPVQAAINRGLSKVPADRFATVAEFVAALSAKAEPDRAEKSIVVLPFVNLSPDPENEYFADGLMEEVIADLSKVRALRVISRNSAIQLKGTAKDTRTIGRELNVRYVLEGSVRRVGNTLRITAQLIDAATDVHLWAEKYPGTVDDVFAMQEQLSKQIVAALEIALTPAEARHLAARANRDPRAYDCYLRARHEAFRGTVESLVKAMELLEAGLADIGPNELLYAGMGTVHWYYTQWGIEASAYRVGKIAEYAAKIRALNPDSAYPELLTAVVYWKQGTLEAAAQHFKRALEFDPSESDAKTYLAYVYLLAGQGDAAVPLIRELEATDPLSLMTGWMTTFLGFFRDQGDSGIAAIERVIASNPENPAARGVHGWILARLGRDEEAIAAFARIRSGFGDHPMSGFWLLLQDALRGDSAKLRAGLSQPATDAAMLDEFGGLVLADAYARVGDTANALRWLHHVTLDRGLVNYPFIMNDPFLAPLQDDPRFVSLMTEVKRRWEGFKV